MSLWLLLHLLVNSLNPVQLLEPKTSTWTLAKPWTKFLDACGEFRSLYFWGLQGKGFVGEEEVLYCLLDPLSFAPWCAHDPDDHDCVQIHTESFLMMMYYKFMQNLRSLQEEYPDDVQIHGRILEVSRKNCLVVLFWFCVVHVLWGSLACMVWTAWQIMMQAVRVFLEHVVVFVPLVVLMSCGGHFSPQFLNELPRFCPSICCCPSYIH